MDKKTIAKYFLKGLGAVTLAAVALWVEDNFAQDLMNSFKK